MTAANQQVVTCYDELGMTPEEIAAEYQWEVSAVKMILNQSSPKFKSENGSKPQADFTLQELEDVKNVIINLALYGEDEAIQLKAAKYVRDDSKGRLDMKSVKTLNVNITQINSRMQKAREAMQRARESKVLVERAAPKVIDITSVASVPVAELVS